MRKWASFRPEKPGTGISFFKEERSIALLVFLAQLLCCILVDGGVKKYIPTLIAACILAFTVLGSSFGILAAIVWVAEIRVFLMGLLAIGIYHIVLWAKK